MNKQPAPKNKQPVGFAVNTLPPFSLPSAELLQGQYVDLVRITEQHIDALYNCFKHIDEDSWTYLWYGPFDTKEDFSNFIHSFCLENDPYFFCVIHKESREVLGMLSLMRIDNTHGVMEVGHVHFGEKLKGTTQATESIFLTMQYAFDLGYRRFEWKCDDLNAPSKKSALRLGFKYEGVFRQHIIYKGRNRDTAWFSILDKEWSTIKSNYEKWLHLDNFDVNGVQKTKLNAQHSE